MGMTDQMFLAYRQKKFLPQMQEHHKRMVEYVVGNVGMELETWV